MSLTTTKSDWGLQVLNDQMMPVAKIDGLILLFENEFVGFGFWHGVIDIDQATQVKGIFEAGQHEDIKIRVSFPGGKTGLAKQVFFRTDQNPLFDQNMLGVVGLTRLRSG